jgi:hypothetical protein
LILAATLRISLVCARNTALLAVMAMGWMNTLEVLQDWKWETEYWFSFPIAVDGGLECDHHVQHNKACTVIIQAATATCVHDEVLTVTQGTIVARICLVDCFNLAQFHWHILNSLASMTVAQHSHLLVINCWCLWAPHTQSDLNMTQYVKPREGREWLWRQFYLWRWMPSSAIWLRPQPNYWKIHSKIPSYNSQIKSSRSMRLLSHHHSLTCSNQLVYTPEQKQQSTPQTPTE